MKGYFPMNNSNAQKKSLSFLGIPAAVLFSYLSAVCALPSSGIFTALPFSALFAVCASLICKNRKTIYAAMAIMHFLTPLLFGFDMLRGLLNAAVAAAASFLAILAKRGFITVKKSKNPDAVKKSKAVIAFSLILSVILWLVCLGNPVSLMLADSSNKSFAKESYGDAVKAQSTFFDVTRFEYVTEITFNNAKEGEKYYISDGRTDDYRAYYLAEATVKATDYFEGQTAISTDFVKCYIDSESFIPGNGGDLSMLLPHTEYFVERTESVTGLSGFAELYGNLMTYADKSDTLVYKSIIMTAPGMDGKTYYAYKEFGKDAVFSVDDEQYKKELKEKFN